MIVIKAHSVSPAPARYMKWGFLSPILYIREMHLLLSASLLMWGSSFDPFYVFFCTAAPDKYRVFSRVFFGSLASMGKTRKNMRLLWSAWYYTKNTNSGGEERTGSGVRYIIG